MPATHTRHTQGNFEGVHKMADAQAGTRLQQGAQWKSLEEGRQVEAAANCHLARSHHPVLPTHDRLLTRATPHAITTTTKCHWLRTRSQGGRGDAGTLVTST
jgi:hypothetical protein